MWADLGEFHRQFESDELSRTSAGNADVVCIDRFLAERWALGLDEAPLTELPVVVSSTTIAAAIQIIYTISESCHSVCTRWTPKWHNVWRRNFTDRRLSCLCNTWAGSFVDRGHYQKDTNQHHVTQLDCCVRLQLLADRAVFISLNYILKVKGPDIYILPLTRKPVA